MLNYQLIKSILSEPWAIWPKAIESASFLLEGVFNPTFAFEGTAQESVNMSPLAESSPVAVVNIVGELTKYDTVCATGMMSYGEIINSLSADPSTSAIVLNIDSPGGMVSGTQDLADIIKSVDKPVIAFVSDLAASAAYWLASACDEIIANNDLAQVGSIGVVATYPDYSEYFKKQGVKLTTLYARQSTHKNDEIREMLQGNSTPILDSLSTYADSFIGSVRSCRPGVLDEQLSGHVYYAKDVLGTLVDSIGNLDYAISRAISLSDASTFFNQNILQMVKTPNLNAVLGVEDLASLEGFVSLNEAQVAQIELALSGGTVTQNEDSVSTDDDALEALSAQNATLTAENAQLKERLAKRPAEASAFVAGSVDPSDDLTNSTMSNPYDGHRAVAVDVRQYN